MSRIFCSFLLVVLLSACTYELNKNVNFQLKYQGRVLDCEELKDSVLFYLSGFTNGNKLTLIPNEFASEEVALLAADCSNNAWQVVFEKGIAAGDTIYFELGVPFHLNHNNPLTAQAPLNVSEMFWSWQLGHKFFRLDTQDGFSFHLGSTGCKSASRLRPATAPCSYPNKFKFEVKNYQPGRPILFDLDALLAGVNQEQSCMSDQANPTCQALFNNLRTALFYQE